MTGEEFAQAQAFQGDPEFVPVVPTEQYLGKYVFFVDTTHPNSQLVVVRSRQSGKDFAPVTLDCAGALEEWTPLGTSGAYEYNRIWLTKEKKPQSVGSGTCGAGRHAIESDGAFAVTVWGTAPYASYGYPGGGALRTLNAVETIIK
jgi:IgGFc binding protein